MTEPDALVVPLSGETVDLLAALASNGLASAPVVRTLPQLLSPPLREGRRLHRPLLAVQGAPPEREIGFAFSPAIGLATRPRRVVLADLQARRLRASSLPRFVASSAPRAARQLGLSALALGAQGVAARTLGRPAPPVSTRRAPALGRLLYLRALVGAETGAGGATTHTHEVIRGLLKIGVEVETATNDRAIARFAAQDGAGYTWRVVEPSPAFGAAPASFAFGVDLALVRSALRTAAHSEVIYKRHARFSLTGAVLSRLTGTPLFLEYNGSEAFFSEHWQRTPMQRRLILCEQAMLAAAARIIVVSELAREQLLERGVQESRVVVIPNAVAAERFALGGGREVRGSLGIPPNQVLVGFVGTFGPWHGAPVLAEAFARLARERSDVRLLLVGDGPEHPRVLARLAEAGCLERVHFTGRAAPEAVPALLDACDVLASPHVPLPGDTPFFGSPTKLFEYMAAGKAIVASGLGQIADVLEHDQTALMATPGDSQELVAAIRRLADDPYLRRRLGAAARRAALDRHSWTSNAQAVRRTYEDWAAEASR